jgi:hypothetical protein
VQQLHLHIRRRADSTPLVLAFRWGVPLAFVIFGIVMLVLSHGHLSGVQDNAQESNVFTGSTFTDRDSMFSAIGVGAIVIAAMIVLLGWMLRLNSDEAGERDEEERAREHFRQTGRWPDD